MQISPCVFPWLRSHLVEVFLDSCLGASLRIEDGEVSQTLPLKVPQGAKNCYGWALAPWMIHPSCVVSKRWGWSALWVWACPCAPSFQQTWFALINVKNPQIFVMTNFWGTVGTTIMGLQLPTLLLSELITMTVTVTYPDLNFSELDRKSFRYKRYFVKLLYIWFHRNMFAEVFFSFLSCSWCKCTGVIAQFWFHSTSRAANRGGVSNGGVSRSGLVLPFVSLFVLGTFPIFRDFPDLLGDGPGIFPIRPFSLSRPIKSTYEEQSRKCPRHDLDLSRKKWETPRFVNPPA